MNKIVRKLYPIDQLPEDLRVGLPTSGWVRIELDVIEEVPGNSLASLVGSGRNIHGDASAVLREIESVRDDR